MFIGKVDEINHVLIAVWCNDLYSSQIDSIVEHYGEEEVKKAEEALYQTTVFKMIVDA